MSTSATAEPSSPLVIVSKEQIVDRAWARYYPFWERCLLWRVLVRSPGGVFKWARQSWPWLLAAAFRIENSATCQNHPESVRDNQGMPGMMEFYQW